MKIEIESTDKGLVRKFTEDQKAAIRGYYSHRKMSFREKSKGDCLDTIELLTRASPQITRFRAIAGTFWFTWSDGSTTIHSEKNWWKMKINSRRDFAKEKRERIAGIHKDTKVKQDVIEELQGKIKTINKRIRELHIDLEDLRIEYRGLV